MRSALSKDQFYVLLSVLCAIFLAALDQTIVATAAPKIANDLNDFEALPWVFSAYMLASTIMIPIYGRFSDMYGRKLFYLSGIIVFLIGSIFSGLAFNMTTLVIARIIQGFGAGSIMVESFTIIGDLFVPAERGKWQGLISSIFGLASIIGPLLGGFLTEYLSWRWIFFINLPIGLLALFLTRIHFPKILKKGVAQPVSYFNAALLALGLLCFLLALLRIERHHNWLVWEIIFLFAGSFVLLFIFALRDIRSIAPIFPAELFKSRIFVLSMLAIFFSSICFYGAIAYIPLFAQTALSQSASQSGLSLLPFVLAVTFASAGFGQLVSRTGKYKAILIIGSAIAAWGFYLLSKMDTHTTWEQLASHMIMIGLGIGAIMPIFIVIVQSSFGHDKLGLVTGTGQLFRNIGATMGTAILGTIINKQLSNELVRIDNKHNLINNEDTSMLNKVTQQLLDQTADKNLIKILQTIFANAISDVFFISTILFLLIFILVLAIPVITLRKTRTS